MNNKSNFDLLQDAHLDNLISLAYKQNEDEEIQSILDEADQRQLSEEEEALSKQIYAHFLEKVEAEKRDEKKKSRREVEQEYDAICRGGRLLSTGDRYFILSTNMSKEEGIAVAESVQRIIK